MALGRPKPARILGRYQLVAELATSYLGPLWAVRAEGADGTSSLAALRLVSLARLNADTRVRLLEAAWQAMEVRHPRVRSVTDVVASDGELGIISEYVEGIPLRALQGLASVRRKPMPVPVALRIVADLVEAAVALDRATAELGAEAVPLYGGLSPDSIVVGTNGATAVLDVVVSSVASSVESLGANPERVAYAAPEQIDATPTVDARADVFTIGIVLWELLSSRRLFVGSDKIVNQKVLAARIPRIDEWKKKGDPELPGGLVKLVTRALARDPAARPASAEELALALAECGAPAGTEEDVRNYVEAIAEGALSRTRDALKEPSRTSRPEAGQWGKLKSPEPARSIPTLSVASAERRSILPAPKVSAAIAPGPKPLSVALGGPRPRQPTMIGIPPPARSVSPNPGASMTPLAAPPAADARVVRVAETVPPAPVHDAAVPADVAAEPVPTTAVVAAPSAPDEAASDLYDDGGDDDPTSQYNARDLLKQVEEMSRRSDPAKRPPTDFPEPRTNPNVLEPEVVPPPPRVPTAVLPPSPVPEEGGWLDDPVMPESVEAVTVRADEPPAPSTARLVPEPARSFVESAAPSAARTTRSLAPSAPSPVNSVRPDRPAFSIAPKAPAPFIPSQMPPPLIHDPRATRKRSAPPLAGPQFNRGVLRGVVVSLGLVVVSAAIAIVWLRSRQTGDAVRDTPVGRSDVPAATAVVAAPATPTPSAAPAAEKEAASAPEMATPEPASAAPASPPVTAAAAPASVVPAAPARSSKAAHRAGKKAHSRFVPDDI